MLCTGIMLVLWVFCNLEIYIYQACMIVNKKKQDRIKSSAKMSVTHSLFLIQTGIDRKNELDYLSLIAICNLTALLKIYAMPCDLVVIPLSQRTV